MTEAMAVYGMVFAKLAIGLLAIILQINLMGKGNLAVVFIARDILSVKTHGHHDWRLLEKRDHPCIWRETQRIADFAHYNGVL